MTRSVLSRALTTLVAASLASLAGSFAAEESGPSGRLIFAVEESHRVAVFTPQGEQIASTPTGLRPRHLLRLADGRILVSNRGRDSAPGSSLTLLAGDDYRPLETIAACNGCGPSGLFADAGGRIYVGAQHHKAIQIFEGPGGAPLRTLLTPWGWPGEIVPLPWGEAIAVAFRDSTEIGLIELDGGRPRSLAVEIDPSELASRPGHEELWVGTRIGRLAVVVPDAESFARVDEKLVVERPLDLAFEPSGKRLFGASARSASVWYVDADERELSGRFPLEGGIAHLLGFSPDGRYLAVALLETPRCLIYDVSRGDVPSLVESFDLPGRVRDLIWLPR